MNNEKNLKAAKCCTNRVSCKDCPICNDGGHDACMIQFANYIVEKEKEPAPAKTGTSTKIKTLHDNDIIRFQICQESARKMLKLKEEFEVAGYEQSKNLTVLMAARGLTISNLLLEIGGE